ncbi:hypothetical protein [Roseomonas xinghualingensis]|uniref:hypothetical protein n=1 Tax=Roseomonas xinghualingensis TaxID=2986475 RepID=UPI0021F164F6|nr:hypothetical protein [Roseomonas sp. SXEYE001]MCV4208323.1 hypothetical protein [Roseomonas sp. SXEYE001]
MKIPPFPTKPTTTPGGRLAIKPGWRWEELALLIGAICLGSIIRLKINLDYGLWEDEIISVTHATQPLPHFFVQVIRNDIHPPLYFLQLHFWGWISHTDYWFKANSVFWGFATLASTWFIIRYTRNASLAWMATAFLAVLPTGLWMSQELRPYAWLSTLVIWAYFFALQIFSTEQTNLRKNLVLLLITWVIIYSHALGFLAVFFNGIFAITLLLRRNASQREFRQWALLYGLAAAASMPTIVSNLLHDANLDDPVSPTDILSWCSALITARDAQGWVWWAGVLTYTSIVACGLAVAHTRAVTTCFLVAPLVVAAVISVTLEPIFKSNFFGSLSAPFIAIVLAELCLITRPQIKRFVTAACLAGLLAIAATGWTKNSSPTDFQHVALSIQPNIQPRDAIYTPQLSIFWGMAWYLAGPKWGSALAVANPPSAQWQRIYALLGPWLVDLLHLMPTTQVVDLPREARLIVGNDSVSQVVEGSRRIWLITYHRADLPDGFPPDSLGPLPKRSEAQHGRLTVSFYE